MAKQTLATYCTKTPEIQNVYYSMPTTEKITVKPQAFWNWYMESPSTHNYNAPRTQRGAN